MCWTIQLLRNEVGFRDRSLLHDQLNWPKPGKSWIFEDLGKPPSKAVDLPFSRVVLHRCYGSVQRLGHLPAK